MKHEWTQVDKVTFAKQPTFAAERGRDVARVLMFLLISRELHFRASIRYFITYSVQFCWILLLAGRRGLHGSLISQGALSQISCKTAVLEAALQLGLRINLGQ